MKAVLSCALALCLLLAPFHALAQAPPDPSRSAKELLASIQGWEQDALSGQLTGDDEDLARAGEYLAVFGLAAQCLAARMEYRVYSGRVTENTAVADVWILAADVGELAETMLAQGAMYVAFQRLLGKPVELDAYLAGRVQEAAPKLLRTGSNVSVYFVRGGDGEWKLDLSDKRNLDFLDALCGGGLASHREAAEKLLDTKGS